MQTYSKTIEMNKTTILTHQKRKNTNEKTRNKIIDILDVPKATQQQMGGTSQASLEKNSMTIMNHYIYVIY
jgi:hypothetical protein